LSRYLRASPIGSAVLSMPLRSPGTARSRTRRRDKRPVYSPASGDAGPASCEALQVGQAKLEGYPQQAGVRSCQGVLRRESRTALEWLAVNPRRRAFCARGSRHHKRQDGLQGPKKVSGHRPAPWKTRRIWIVLPTSRYGTINGVLGITSSRVPGTRPGRPISGLLGSRVSTLWRMWSATLFAGCRIILLDMGPQRDEVRQSPPATRLVS
jgi:hypothetical protein